MGDGYGPLRRTMGRRAGAGRQPVFNRRLLRGYSTGTVRTSVPQSEFGLRCTSIRRYCTRSLEVRIHLADAWRSR